MYLDRVLLGFLSFKRVILLKAPLSRAPLRPHYWCVGSIVSLAKLSLALSVVRSPLTLESRYAETSTLKSS